jgi:bifunctional non-homologous end joining protein LigD
MSTRTVPGTSREAFEYCVVNDLPSLVWVANLASIELHPLLALGDRLDEPSMVVFDLNPGPLASILECCRVALRLRRLLAELDLGSFPKTSGATGLHVCVPLNSPHTYRQTRALARRLARRLVTEVPELATDRRDRALRMGKVLLDWSQNNPAKSMVSVYSLRATEVPSVSTPLSWSEVGRALETGDPDRLRFGPAQVLKRLDRLGDLFGPVVQTKQQIPS